MRAIISRSKFLVRSSRAGSAFLALAGPDARSRQVPKPPRPGAGCVPASKGSSKPERRVCYCCIFFHLPSPSITESADFPCPESAKGPHYERRRFQWHVHRESMSHLTPPERQCLWTFCFRFCASLSPRWPLLKPTPGASGTPPVRSRLFRAEVLSSLGGILPPPYLAYSFLPGGWEVANEK